MTKEQRLSCTRGLSQLRRSVPTAALIHGACFLNRRRADTPADVPHGTLEEHADTTMLFESLLEENVDTNYFLKVIGGKC